MTPQLIPSQKMSTYFFNKNSSDLRCLAGTELRVVWRPGGGTESSIFFSWNYWIPLHLSDMSPAEHNMATQCAGQRFYCRILKFQYFRFKLSILPNFIVNKVLFLILVGGMVGGPLYHLSRTSRENLGPQREIYSFYSSWGMEFNKRPKTKAIFLS